MTSWMHQMMSQQQQVMETTPGHLISFLTASETVNLAEKNSEAHTKGATGNTMMGKSLLWAPC